MRKELGRISKVSFGFGGYQDAMFGLSLSFNCDGGVCSNFIGCWPLTMKRSESAEWSERDREKQVVESIRTITETMQKAKVEDVSDLLGIPVECTFDGQMLKEWRVLEEVL